LVGLANDSGSSVKARREVQRTSRGITPRPGTGARQDANFSSPMQEDHRPLGEHLAVQHSRACRVVELDGDSGEGLY
jgi:hypothetical protein